MYYVIKKQLDNPSVCFVGFKIPKYIASKSNNNVIFEFEQDGKIQRKWISKEDIILLTQDKAFFLETIRKFKAVEATQQQLVNKAKENLTQTMTTFTETVNAEIDDFETLRDSTDVPCILKDL